MRFVAWCLALLIAAAQAQAADVAEMSEPMKLQRLADSFRIDFMSRCGGQYFMQEIIARRGEYPEVWIGAIAEKNGSFSFVLLSQGRFRTVIDDGLTAPTIQYEYRVDEVDEEVARTRTPNTVVIGTRYATVRISQKEYQKAAGCLPRP